MFAHLGKRTSGSWDKKKNTPLFSSEQSTFVVLVTQKQSPVRALATNYTLGPLTYAKAEHSGDTNTCAPAGNPHVCTLRKAHKWQLGQKEKDPRYYARISCPADGLQVVNLLTTCGTCRMSRKERERRHICRSSRHTNGAADGTYTRQKHCWIGRNVPIQPF